MKLVTTITVDELQSMSKKMFGNMVKAVVDVNKRELVLDAEMHVDEEQYLLEKGSKQPDLWGINLHPSDYGQRGFIEYDSMINIRPSQKNMSRGVEDPKIRRQIIEIVTSMVTK